MSKKTGEQLRLGKETVDFGERKTIPLPVARFYTHTEVTMLVHVIRGKEAGPHLFLSAALHGDELNGVEIIRRVIRRPELANLKGALIAVPVANAFAFINQSRYLPDNRDLNRSFPGRKKGSLAAELARLFMDEIMKNSSHGIDFHTGSRHRANLPHIRAKLDDEGTRQLAVAFGTPVILNSNLRDGSLRQAADDQNIPLLVYEGGEALRFDEVAIRAGVNGTLSVMKKIGMIASEEKEDSPQEPFVANSSRWVRAPHSGVVRVYSTLGRKVAIDEVLGVISDPLGEKEEEILCPHPGIIIGQSNLPLVNRGEALFHVACFDSPGSVASRLEEFQFELESELNEETDYKNDPE